MERRRPSIADRLVSVGALFAAAAVLAFFRIRSTDIFWHLAAGRWIFEHRELPRFDPFRFTSAGAPWVDHEWLFQVLAHACERFAGLDSLILLRVVLVGAIAALLYRTGRRSGLSPPVAVVLAALALFGVRPRMILRPELFTFVALLLLLELLDRLRSRPGRDAWKPVLAMAALTVAWANLHGAALLSPVVAGLHLLGCRLQPPRSAPPLGRVLGVPAVLLAATLINPYGYHVLLVSFGISSAMRGLPGTNAEWAPQWLAPQPYFLLGVAAVAGLAVLARRRAPGVDLATGLVALALTAVAATAVRHQALFFIGSAPFAARALAGVVAAGRPAPRRSPLPRYAALATCALIILWTLLPPSSGWLRPRQGAFTFGLGIEPGRFPEAAGDFLERHPEIGPLYNTFAWGGYQLWRFYPPRQVFQDGRMELVPGFLNEIGAARADGRAWEELMLRHGVDGALVRYEERLRPVLAMGDGGEPRLTGHRTANALLFPRPLYALVYWDDVGMLLVRRTPERATWLAASEYRQVDPEDLAWTLERAASSPAFADGALRDVERRLGEDPGSRRALRLREELRTVR